MSDNGGHPLEDGQETMDQLAIAMLAPVVNLGVAPYPRLNPGEQPESSGIYTVHVGPRSLGGGDPIWTLASWLSHPKSEELAEKISDRATISDLQTKVLSASTPSSRSAFSSMPPRRQLTCKSLGHLWEKDEAHPSSFWDGGDQALEPRHGVAALASAATSLTPRCTGSPSRAPESSGVWMREAFGCSGTLAVPLGKPKSGRTPSVYLPDMGSDGGGLWTSSSPDLDEEGQSKSGEGTMFNASLITGR